MESRFAGLRQILPVRLLSAAQLDKAWTLMRKRQVRVATNRMYRNIFGRSPRGQLAPTCQRHIFRKCHWPASCRQDLDWHKEMHQGRSCGEKWSRMG